MKRAPNEAIEMKVAPNEAGRMMRGRQGSRLASA
jgi:hypothetical protein